MNRRPGSVRFTGTWWSAVFPLGTYSSATQAVARQLHLTARTTVSLILFGMRSAISCWSPSVAAFAGPVGGRNSPGLAPQLGAPPDYRTRNGSAVVRLSSSPSPGRL